MTDDAQQSELQQLRQQVEEYRARELETLRTQLAEARDAADKWRTEAYRLDGVLKKIAAEADVKITELTAKLEARDQLASHVNRRSI